ncbi:dockerin type I repeat-containing protein [Ruminococcus flavefaciens]|uniref:dockerin type I repeat-containing protein n=1 Tax=Ruminococcus flavefaciens TaxID=1265 RepID=UPI0026F0A223|nr:dockerin type I repeat-containing protein [Ruminococcus flavefaciens]MDD7515892.1 dockerin type I repeat-containing protein [Ruminococcus flavefaciens]MDY5691773.1 dockerin type I repeat-containing protein [Ruminococcus flavefaciens]
MKGKKISAALFAVCILGNGAAYCRNNSTSSPIIAYADTVDSGYFSGNLKWEAESEGILKFSGSGEITEWPLIEYNAPWIYTVRQIEIGSGITKVGYVDYSDYGLEKITILNPECIICETPDNADPADSDYISPIRYGGVICGYRGSTAQSYAEKHGFSFIEIDETPVRIKGDVNGDGEFSISDVVTLQKWLLAVPDTELVDWKAADLCEDDKIDVFDLCLMRKEVILKP